ncbi:MAG: transcriptional regulator [Gammaproteobacteria bacterium]|nr:transcriptional regulator [Gammaproteobacteria bacterium]
MKLKPIRSDLDLELALERIEALWGAKPGTAKGDELDILMLLVERYEEERFPIPGSDPIEAIKFLVEQNDLSRLDLETYIGPRGRVSEVLNGKRNLTLPMIKRLNKSLKNPYENLIR